MPPIKKYAAASLCLMTPIIILLLNDYVQIGVAAFLTITIYILAYQSKKYWYKKLHVRLRKLAQAFRDWVAHKPPFYRRVGEENEEEFPGPVISRKKAKHAPWPEFHSHHEC